MVGGDGAAVAPSDWMATMITRIHPVTLEGHGVRLEPLAYEHHDGLAVAAADGKLWELWFAGVPEPGQTGAYIADALAGQAEGHMLPWAVRELTSGTSSAAALSRHCRGDRPHRDRVHLVCTALATSPRRHRLQADAARSRVDALGSKVAGLRTDQFNLASRPAIGLGCQEGWDQSPPPSSSRWNGARHRDL